MTVIHKIGFRRITGLSKTKINHCCSYSNVLRRSRAATPINRTRHAAIQMEQFVSVHVGKLASYDITGSNKTKRGQAVIGFQATNTNFVRRRMRRHPVVILPRFVTALSYNNHLSHLSPLGVSCTFKTVPRSHIGEPGVKTETALQYNGLSSVSSDI